MNDPHEQVMRLALGHVASRAIFALVHFRIADHLAAGPRTAAELARITATHERSLRRMLRAAAALRLVTEQSDGSFALAHAGAAHRRCGAPSAM